MASPALTHLEWVTPTWLRRMSGHHQPKPENVWKEINAQPEVASNTGQKDQKFSLKRLSDRALWETNRRRKHPMSISIATTKPSTTKASGDAAVTAFEREMRALGYRNFEKERGQYCLQVLNVLKLAYLAGCRNACEAA